MYVSPSLELHPARVPAAADVGARPSTRRPRPFGDSDPLEISRITYVPLFTYDALLAVDIHNPPSGKPVITAKDLEPLTLTTFPENRNRLDIFTHFLNPADVEPAQIRTSELTVMMMQLVASGIHFNFFALWQFLSKLQLVPDTGTAGTMLVFFSKGVDTMLGDYSLSDVLERIYHNQLALEAALMELTLHIEQQGAPKVGDNVRGALQTIGENAGHIKQGLAKLRTKDL